MADKNLFDRYLLALRKTPIDEKTEHTDRAALQDLLQAVADDIATGITVQHEPRRVADKPFATGLKAADPAAAANAGAACGRAAALARVARAKAELAQREEATICAIDTVGKAFAELNRYRAARAKAAQPGLRDDDRVAQLLVRMAEIAAARLQRLVAGSSFPSPLVGALPKNH